MQNLKVRIAIICLVIFLIIGSSFCVSNIKVYFTYNYFVAEDDPLQDVFDVQDKYFNDSGKYLDIYTYSRDDEYLDMSSLDF